MVKTEWTLDSATWREEQCQHGGEGSKEDFCEEFAVEGGGRLAVER